jgi:multicomponent Na+:H+ antiporter subunit C
MSVTLAFTAAVLFGIGTYLVLQHTLTRILIGIALVTHGANVLLVGSARRGDPPIIGTGDEAAFSDPLPQALALTAIVISFGVSALLLALAYRSWLLTHDDEVQDDVTDRAIAGGGVADKEVGDEQEWHELRDLGHTGTTGDRL